MIYLIFEGMRWVFWVSLFCFSLPAAADSLQLVRSIPMKGRWLTADELGNIYVVKKDNSLTKYNEKGDSLAFFHAAHHGAIAAVDVTNPLKIMVYYPEFSKIIFLDGILSVKNELNLKTVNIFATPVVALSAEGGIWAYDQFNVTLKKMDDQLQEIGHSNDLRNEARAVPVPSYMTERRSRVFLCDTAQGIFTFDRYGNYINTLAIYGVSYLQVFGSQLLYRHEDTLFSWDLEKAAFQTLIIPKKEKGIQGAALMRNQLVVLYKESLGIFALLP